MKLKVIDRDKKKDRQKMTKILDKKLKVILSKCKLDLIGKQSVEFCCLW